MENIHSTRGYILTLQQENPPLTPPTLTMEGTVQDPATQFALYCNENNWIGYFLYQNQSVFYALGDYEPYIYHIMHQDFTCYRYNFPVSYECDAKSTSDYPPGTWICNKAPNIKYGDMIIVKPTRDLPEFSWSLSHFTSSFTRPDVEYYVVEEKATYTTLVIELDTTQELPQEIGAFVNDTCVGAGSVVEGDSVIILQAYLGDNPGDSLVFEEHYDAKSTADRKVDDYLVLNPESRIKERRAIKTGEGSNVHIISFAKTEENDEESLSGLALDIYPNPANGQVTIEYTLDREGSINIDVFDKLGRKVKSVNGLQQSKGTYTLQWNLENNSGHRLAPGVYLVRLTSGKRSASRKVMVQ